MHSFIITITFCIAIAIAALVVASLAEARKPHVDSIAQNDKGNFSALKVNGMNYATNQGTLAKLPMVTGANEMTYQFMEASDLVYNPAASANGRITASDVQDALQDLQTVKLNKADFKAKGDLLTKSGAVSVGTDNQVLIASPTESGMGWSDISAPILSQYLGSSTRISLVANDFTPTIDQWTSFTVSPLFIDGSGMTATRTIDLGDDTAANARAYHTAFGLTETSDRTWLTFQLSIAQAAFDMHLANNTGGTSNHVGVLLANDNYDFVQTISPANADPTSAGGGTIKIEVRGEGFGTGNEIVRFNVVQVGH